MSKAWKDRERQAARFWGAERNVGSGCDFRLRGSRSDSVHDVLYLEVKLRAKFATWTLWRETKARAEVEGKVPVVMLAEKFREGQLIVVHTADLDELLRQRWRARFGAIALEKLDGLQPSQQVAGGRG